MESSTLRHHGPDDERSARSVVRVPVRPTGVAQARALVVRAASRAGLSPDRTDDLVIAASEAVTNAIEAQLRAAATAPIVVRCTATATVVEVEVRDSGGGFDPEEVRVRPPLGDPGHLDVERGWGIQLMRELVDELVFDLTGSGMIVRLRVALD